MSGEASTLRCPPLTPQPAPHRRDVHLGVLGGGRARRFDERRHERRRLEGRVGASGLPVPLEPHREPRHGGVAPGEVARPLSQRPSCHKSRPQSLPPLDREPAILVGFILLPHTFTSISRSFGRVGLRRWIKAPIRSRAWVHTSHLSSSIRRISLPPAAADAPHRALHLRLAELAPLQRRVPIGGVVARDVGDAAAAERDHCLLYTSPSPRDS